MEVKEVEEFSSYKDAEARIFIKNGTFIRKIYNSYKASYDKLMGSFLYKELTEKGFLIKHKELFLEEEGVYKIIEPEEVFISYPFEWSFSQLKDAALLTLNIQKIALKYGMSLKDANFFNVQFKDNKPILIDTTSFEIYKEGEPWAAYGQLCTNFLAPLLLASYKDLRLLHLLLRFKEGVPLDLASKLLPKKTYFSFDVLLHIHLHSKFEEKMQNKNNKTINANVSKEGLLFIIDSLIKCTENIKPPAQNTEWKNYYKNTNYTSESFELKKRIIEKYKNKIPNLNKVVDFGANIGVFSRIFSNSGIETFSFDIDENAVDENYQIAKNSADSKIFPLVVDVLNPTPDFGFQLLERKSILKRIKGANLVLALAFVHHLFISNNIPFYKIASFFASVAPFLIVEFCDKDDSKVAFMLSNKRKGTSFYNEQSFENEFSKFYKILDKDKVQGAKRTLYLMERI